MTERIQGRSQKVIIVDIAIGNLHSIVKAFAALGADVSLSCNDREIKTADRLVLPGDGAFPAVMDALTAKPAILQALHQRVIGGGVPFLGVCIGMQIMAEWGLEYEKCAGLGWIKGTVKPINPKRQQSRQGGRPFRVPHMGWNTLDIEQADHAVLRDIEANSHMYFIHSYHLEVINAKDRLASVDYGRKLAAIVGKDNWLGVQFHPEKSQALGLALLDNFLAWQP